MSIVPERISKLDFDFVDHLVSKDIRFSFHEIYISIKTGDLDMIDLITANSDYGINRYADSIFLSGNIEVVEHFREDVIAHSNASLMRVIEDGSAEFLEYVLETKLRVITNIDDLLVSFYLTDNFEKINIVREYTPKNLIDEKMIMSCYFANCDCETWDYYYKDIDFDEIYSLFLSYTWFFSQKSEKVKKNAFRILEHITKTRGFTKKECEEICDMTIRKKLYDVSG